MLVSAKLTRSSFFLIGAGLVARRPARQSAGANPQNRNSLGKESTH